MARPKRSEKERQRDKLKELFPDAIDLMRAVLRDESKDTRGRKVVATMSQKLAIAHRIVDQVVGRPAQAVPMGPDNDRPPISTLEIVKSYGEAVSPTEDISTDSFDELIPVNSPPPGPIDREDWLQAVEKEALGAVDIPAEGLSEEIGGPF